MAQSHRLDNFSLRFREHHRARKRAISRQRVRFVGDELSPLAEQSLGGKDARKFSEKTLSDHSTHPMHANRCIKFVEQPELPLLNVMDSTTKCNNG